MGDVAQKGSLGQECKAAPWDFRGGTGGAAATRIVATLCWTLGRQDPGLAGSG